VAVTASPAADILRKSLRVDSGDIFPRRKLILNFGEYTTAQQVFRKCERKNQRSENYTKI